MSEEEITIIDEETFSNAEPLPKVELEHNIVGVNDAGFNDLLVQMQNPVEAQKILAVQIQQFLDKRIDDEMKSKGTLSDFTRRWVTEYNSILEKLQKSLYGDKSVNLHLHKITHSQVAAKIRGVKNVNSKD